MPWQCESATDEIPAESIQLLKGVGAWMKVNGESIYGTHASPFKALPWGRCTVKDAGPNTTLYLHVLNWPAAGKLLVPGLANPIQSAALLAGGAALAVKKSAAGPVLTLPATAPDAICSAIKVVITGKPEVVVLPVQPGKDGVITLTPADARCDGRQVKSEQKGRGPANLGFWTDPADTVSWNLQADRDGNYALTIETATLGQGPVIKILGAATLASPPRTTKPTTPARSAPLRSPKAARSPSASNPSRKAGHPSTSATSPSPPCPSPWRRLPTATPPTPHHGSGRQGTFNVMSPRHCGDLVWG